MSKDQMEIKTTEQIREEYQETIERLSKMCYIKDDLLILQVGGEYNIALSRCDTAEKLLTWVHHLSEKTWMTRELLQFFMEKVADHHRIDLHSPGV